MPEHLQILALPIYTLDQDQDRAVPADQLVVLRVAVVALLRPLSLSPSPTRPVNPNQPSVFPAARLN
jgi:hypothetical protein